MTVTDILSALLDPMRQSIGKAASALASLNTGFLGTLAIVSTATMAAIWSRARARCPVQSASLSVTGPTDGERGEAPDFFPETRTYLLFGGMATAFLFGSVGVWAATTNIAGAVLASGFIVVDSDVKKMQHPTGGVVSEILVKEGMHVNAHEVLVRLDETLTRANLQMIAKQLDEIAVRKARLRAELNDKNAIALPASVVERRSEPQLEEITASESALFSSRRKARASIHSQFRERISQLASESTGLEAHVAAKTEELKLALEELEGLEVLEKQKLVSTTKITVSRRTVAQLRGDLAQAQAAVAQARGKIAEIELQISQSEAEWKSSAGKEMRELQAKEAEYTERRIAAEDQLSRTEIRAPQSGYVHQLAVNTLGGVISPSDTIMTIVPDTDQLVIEAKIAPQDIDQVAIGATAHVRFSAFNRQTTPEFNAVVKMVSPDLVTEASRNAKSYYYVARLEVDTAKYEAKELRLLPGMPAEVHITTSDRTVASYFLKPLHDHFRRAFRER